MANCKVTVLVTVTIPIITEQAMQLQDLTPQSVVPYHT